MKKNEFEEDRDMKKRVVGIVMIVLALAAVAMGVLWQRALRDDSDMAALLAADVRDESGYLRLADLRNTLQE